MTGVRHAFAVFAGLVLAAPRPTAAQEPDAPAPETEAIRRNSIALFVGATAESEEETAFTIGLDYERRLGGPFGVGVLADKPFGAARSFLILGGFFWHPIRPVRLDLAPGLEIIQDEDDAFVLRLGADYDFELTERWSVAPNLNVDFVSGRTVWVLGAELAYTF